MRTDLAPAGLRLLEPERRALLELSFRRGVSDEEIAELLGVAPDEVQRRREEGVERLGGVLGLEGSAEHERLAQALRAMPQEAWDDPSEGDWRGPKLVVGIGFAAAALAAAGLALAATSGEDDRGSERPAAVRQAATRVERPTGARRARLRPVASSTGAGAVQLVERDGEERLLATVRKLPPPGRDIYVVWLYKAVDDAVAIGGSKRTSFRLNARLPEGAARYPSLDISLEPRDGNDAHAGGSVLRAPLAPLREAD